MIFVPCAKFVKGRIVKRGRKIMGRVRFGILEDKLMAEQTKVAIKAVEKRCQGVRCGMLKVSAEDMGVLLKLVYKGKLDALAMGLREWRNCCSNPQFSHIADDITDVAFVRNVDNRYVLMTRKKSGKHFSNALVACTETMAGIQLQQMFDGVTCVKTAETIRGQIDRLLSGGCEGVLASCADVINTGCSKVSKVRYKHFDDNTIIPETGDGVLVVLCKKNSECAEILGKADNKRLRKEIAIEDMVRKCCEGNERRISVRANLRKEKLDISTYVKKDDFGKYIQRSGSYLEKNQMIIDVSKEICDM